MNFESSLRSWNRRNVANVDICLTLENCSIVLQSISPDLDLSMVKNCWQSLVNPTNHWEVQALGLLFITELLKSKQLSSICHKTETEISWMELVCAIFCDMKMLFVHDEARIRSLCIEALKGISEGSNCPASRIFEELGKFLIERVNLCFSRTDTIGPALLGQTSVQLDDTTGWKDLESSLKAIYSLILALSSRSEFNYFSEVTSEGEDLLITAASTHTNRYVRQCCLEFIGELASISIFCASCSCSCQQPSECTGTATTLSSDLIVENPPPAAAVSVRCEACRVSRLHKLMATAIASGLQENWSQIRLVSISSATRFLSGLGASERESFWDILLPGLCVNRFFSAAPGVQSAAMNSWKTVVGLNGRLLLAAHAPAVVSFYINMTKATNHEVSEAACHALAEFVARIDRAVVAQQCPQIIDAIGACLGDPSWPVRDAACCASGVVVREFPLESRYALSLYTNAWCLHLKDAISSVRENAAIAIGHAISTEHCLEVKDETLQHAKAYLRENLQAAKVAQVPVQRSFLPTAMVASAEAPSSAVMQRSIKSSWRRGGGWGCCLDCMVERKSLPWEVIAGSYLLLIEVAASCPSDAMEFIPLVIDQLQRPAVKDADKLHVFILDRLASLMSHLVSSPQGLLALTTNLPVIESLAHSPSTCEEVRYSALACVQSLSSYLS